MFYHFVPSIYNYLYICSIKNFIFADLLMKNYLQIAMSENDISLLLPLKDIFNRHRSLALTTQHNTQFSSDFCVFGKLALNHTVVLLEELFSTFSPLSSLTVRYIINFTFFVFYVL